MQVNFPQNLNLNINYEDEPIRLFKSDFLEFFTHVHPAVVPTLWLPVTAYFLYQTNASPLVMALGFALGVLFIWSFIEYVVHRFIFHYEPRTALQERIIFVMHEVHHVQPNCKTRLVMPPAISIPGAIWFYVLFHWLIIGLFGEPGWFEPVFAGMVFGYVAYDMVHYATHHLPMKGRLMKALKRHHMLHHFQDPHQRFGVTMPAWDYVFGTQPEDFLKSGK